MPIEILEDWNAILEQCCCPMPECPLPVIECKGISASAQPDGYFDPDATEWIIYRKLTEKVELSGSYDDGFGTTITANGHETQTYENPGWFAGSINNIGSGCYVWENATVYTCSTALSQTTSSSISTTTVTRTDLFGTLIPDSDPPEYYDVCAWRDRIFTDYVDPGTPDTEEFFGGVSITSYGFPGGFTYSTTYSFPQTFAEWKSGVLDEVIAKIAIADESCWVEGACQSTLSISPDTPANPSQIVGVSMHAVRFRFVIPSEFTGAYFKVTWDVAFFPTGGGAASAILENQTWEWTGPGDPEVEDSWVSEWFDLDPPSEEGAARVVNIRYECYRTPQFGNKPQITGEGVDFE